MDWTGGLDWWTGLVDWIGGGTGGLIFYAKNHFCALLLDLTLLHINLDGQFSLCVDLK